MPGTLALKPLQSLKSRKAGMHLPGYSEIGDGKTLVWLTPVATDVLLKAGINLLEQTGGVEQEALCLDLSFYIVIHRDYLCRTRLAQY